MDFSVVICLLLVWLVIVGVFMGGLIVLFMFGEDIFLDCEVLVLVDVVLRLEFWGVCWIIEFMCYY